MPGVPLLHDENPQALGELIANAFRSLRNPPTGSLAQAPVQPVAPGYGPLSLLRAGALSPTVASPVDPVALASAAPTPAALAPSALAPVPFPEPPPRILLPPSPTLPEPTIPDVHLEGLSGPQKLLLTLLTVGAGKVVPGGSGAFVDSYVGSRMAAQRELQARADTAAEARQQVERENVRTGYQRDLAQAELDRERQRLIFETEASRSLQAARESADRAAAERELAGRAQLQQAGFTSQLQLQEARTRGRLQEQLSPEARRRADLQPTNRLLRDSLGSISTGGLQQVRDYGQKQTQANESIFEKYAANWERTGSAVDYEGALRALTQVIQGQDLQAQADQALQQPELLKSLTAKQAAQTKWVQTRTAALQASAQTARDRMAINQYRVGLAEASLNLRRYTAEQTLKLRAAAGERGETTSLATVLTSLAYLSDIVPNAQSPKVQALMGKTVNDLYEQMGVGGAAPAPSPQPTPGAVPGVAPVPAPLFGRPLPVGMLIAPGGVPPNIPPPPPPPAQGGGLKAFLGDSFAPPPAPGQPITKSPGVSGADIQRELREAVSSGVITNRRQLDVALSGLTDGRERSFPLLLQRYGMTEKDMLGAPFEALLPKAVSQRIAQGKVSPALAPPRVEQVRSFYAPQE